MRVIVSQNGDLAGGVIDVLALALLGWEAVSCEEESVGKTAVLRMRFDEINDFSYRRELICQYFHANPVASVLEVAKALPVSVTYIEHMWANNLCVDANDNKNCELERQ